MTNSHPARITLPCAPGAIDRVKRKHRIVAALAGVGLVVPLVADRVTAQVIEHRLAERLRCVAGLTTEPEVELRGFPALTQVAAGRLTEIRVTAADVPVRAVTIRRLSAVAEDVRLSGNGSVGTVTVDATVAYAGLSAAGLGAAETGSDRALPDGMRIAGADDASRLMLEGALPVRGVTMPVTVYADLVLADGRLTVTPAEVELSSLGLRLPAKRLPAAARQSRSITLPELPAGLTYQSVRATPDGLQVVTQGADLHGTARNRTGKTTCGGTA